MITEILLGIGGIILVVMICSIFVIVCISIGHLCSYKDLYEDDVMAFYFGLRWIMLAGLITYGLYWLGKWMLINW